MLSGRCSGRCRHSGKGTWIPVTREREISQEREIQGVSEGGEESGTRGQSPLGGEKAACRMSCEDPASDSWRNGRPFPGSASSDVAGLQSDRIALVAVSPGLMGTSRSSVLSA